MTNPNIVTVGGITLDWVVTSGGEVSLKNFGGNCTYAAVGARLWTDRVAIVGLVGNDFPNEYLSDLSESGIDITGIHHLAEPHELVYAMQFNAKGERHPIQPREFFPSIGITTPEAMEDHVLYHEPWDCETARHFDVEPDQVPPHFWQAKGFHIARMHRQAEIDLASELDRRSIFFSLDTDCSSCDEGERRRLLRIIPALLPSEPDVVMLLDDPNPDMHEALRRLCAMGPRVVAIKMGGEGSIVYDSRTGLERHVPIIPTNAKDPTGAGDSYCGGFLAGYLETGDAFEAALRGTVSSSFIVEDFDARYALRFTRSQAEVRLDALRKLAA